MLCIACDQLTPTPFKVANKVCVLVKFSLPTLQGGYPNIYYTLFQILEPVPSFNHEYLLFTIDRIFSSSYQFPVLSPDLCMISTGHPLRVPEMLMYLSHETHSFVVVAVPLD